MQALSEILLKSDFLFHAAWPQISRCSMASQLVSDHVYTLYIIIINHH